MLRHRSQIDITFIVLAPLPKLRRRAPCLGRLFHDELVRLTGLPPAQVVYRRVEGVRSATVMTYTLLVAQARRFNIAGGSRDADGSVISVGGVAHDAQNASSTQSDAVYGLVAAAVASNTAMESSFATAMTLAAQAADAAASDRVVTADVTSPTAVQVADSSPTTAPWLPPVLGGAAALAMVAIVSVVATLVRRARRARAGATTAPPHSGSELASPDSLTTSTAGDAPAETHALAVHNTVQ